MAYSVVIVDDEKWLIVDLLKSVAWEEYGFHVASYHTSPTEALEKICKLRPDIVLTDIRMPRLSGIELVERARQAGVNSEFVIISAYADFESAQKAIKLSVTDYLLKPVNPESLAGLLNTLKARLDQKAGHEPDSTASADTFPPQSNSVSFSKILDYIKNHLAEKILLSDISEEFYLNKNYICHLFNKNLNTTFSRYITRLRVSEAKRLLGQTGLTLEEVAKLTGIGDTFYFNKVYKKQEGVSPGAYRKALEARTKK